MLQQYFYTFPSHYLFAIGQLNYLALARGRADVRTKTLVLSYSWPANQTLQPQVVTCWNTTFIKLACFQSRSPLLPESRLISDMTLFRCFNSRHSLCMISHHNTSCSTNRFATLSRLSFIIINCPGFRHFAPTFDYSKHSTLVWLNRGLHHSCPSTITGLV